jgi:hypothetical protein
MGLKRGARTSLVELNKATDSQCNRAHFAGRIGVSVDASSNAVSVAGWVSVPP